MSEVAVTAPLPGTALARLGKVHLLRVRPPGPPLGGKELARFIGQAEACICLLADRVTAEVFQACTRLRVVANYAVGFNNIDLEAAAKARVVVTNTPEVLTNATADLTWALILAVSRRVVEGDRLVREGRFTGWKPDLLLGTGLQGKTLGVVGLGRIGSAVARRGVAFGMRVAAFTTPAPVVPPDFPCELVSDLDALLPRSDVLTLHCPLTPQTRRLIDARRLALLPPGAILVNTSRGEVVDEAALVAALEAGRLAGAGLDVFEREPAVHPGLPGRSDIVLLPHLGSATRETRAAMADLAVDNVLAVLAGQPPLTPVLPPALPVEPRASAVQAERQEPAGDERATSLQLLAAPAATRIPGQQRPVVPTTGLGAPAAAGRTGIKKRFLPLPDATRRLVLIATLVGALPRIYLAAVQFIEYDGWWHIFIASQDTLANFLWEVQSQAHPPLFYLLLRGAMAFGQSRLVYRGVSLLAGLATAYVLGKVAARWSRHWAVPALAALAVSLSWNAIEISCEVRAYMLLAFFLVVALRSFLELLTPRYATLARHFPLLCVASTLALLTHYSAVLFFASAGVLFGVLVALRPRTRLRAIVAVRKRPLAVLVPTLLPFAGGWLLYAWHLRSHPALMSHLPEFYLSSSTASGPLAFVVRNTSWLVDLFSPFSVRPATLSGQLFVALALVASIWLALLIPSPPGRRSVHRESGLLLVALLAGAVVFGLLDKYPYGGPLRHQFYLFPVAVLFVALTVDAALARLRSGTARAGIVIGVLGALAAAHVAGVRTFSWYSKELFDKETARLEGAIAPGSGVYLDQFSLIAFYSRYHDWTWRYAGVCPSNWSILRYELSKGQRKLTVFRDRARWSIHDQIERAASDLRCCAEGAAPHPLVVFALKQFPERDTPSSLLGEEGQAQARKFWALAGVRTHRLETEGSLAMVEVSLDPELEVAP